MALARAGASPQRHKAPVDDLEHVVPGVRGHEGLQNAEQRHSQVAVRPFRIKPWQVHAQHFHRRRSVPLRRGPVLPHAQGHSLAVELRLHTIHVRAVALVQALPLQKNVEVAMPGKRQQHLVRQQQGHLRLDFLVLLRGPHADCSHICRWPQRAFQELRLQASGGVLLVATSHIAQSHRARCSRIVCQRLNFASGQSVPHHVRLQVRAHTLLRRQRAGVHSWLSLGEHGRAHWPLQGTLSERKLRCECQSATSMACTDVSLFSLPDAARAQGRDRVHTGG